MGYYNTFSRRCVIVDVRPANHDYVMVFAKAIDLWQRNLLPRSQTSNENYGNPDNDPRGVWTSSDLSARNYYSAGTYPVVSPSGRVIEGPPKGRYWTISKEEFLEFDKENRIWWGAGGNNRPRFKRFLSEVREGMVPQTIWMHSEVGNTQEAKKEVIAVLPDAPDVFQTTKPERLIKRILDIASSPGDIVLDSFAGSGTTGAVAHKMGRRWIMVELGDHCHTHIIPRMKKVINGEDLGISILSAVEFKPAIPRRLRTSVQTCCKHKYIMFLQKEVIIARNNADQALNEVF
jgi:adenine-specific DNA-methyltransferase